MPLIIELAPEIEAALRTDATLSGRPVEVVAAARVTEYYEWDDEESDAIQGIQRGLEAARKGDEMPFEKYVAAVMAQRQSAKNGAS